MNVKRYSIADSARFSGFFVRYSLLTTCSRKTRIFISFDFTTDTGRDAIAIKYVIRRTVFKVRNILDNFLSIFPK